MDLYMDEPSQSETVLEELYDAFDLSKRNITAQITRDGRRVGVGAFADVVRGTWNIPHQYLDPTTGRSATFIGETRQVAIKEIRVLDMRSFSWKKLLNRLFHEIGIWCWLDHDNILPFYGYSLDEDGRVALISPWCEFGSLPDFLKEHPEASRENLVLDVAEGMAYLHGHSPPIIHGDMKGANILINKHGIACISDFGISMFVEDACVETGFTTTNLTGGSTRWMAPELFQFAHDTTSEDGHQEDGNPSKTFATDMYALGGVLLEILSGKVPYYYLRSDPQVMLEIHQGRLPRAEKYGFKDDFIWVILTALWSTMPAHRPSAQAIVNTLSAHYVLGPREIHAQSQRPLSKVNGVFTQWNYSSLNLDQLNMISSGSFPQLSPDGATLCCRYSNFLTIAFIDIKASPILSWIWTPPENIQSTSTLTICTWNRSSSLVAVCLETRRSGHPQFVLLDVQAQTGAILQLPFSNRIHEAAFNTDDSLNFILQVDGRSVLAACRLSNGYTTFQPPHNWVWAYPDSGLYFSLLTHNGAYIRVIGDDVGVTELSGATISTKFSQISPPQRSHCHPDNSFFAIMPISMSRIIPNVAPNLATLYHLSLLPDTLSPVSLYGRVAATKVEIYIKSKVGPSALAQCKGWLISQLEWGTFGIWHYSTPRLLATIIPSNDEATKWPRYRKILLAVHENIGTIATMDDQWVYIYRFPLPSIS